MDENSVSVLVVGTSQPSAHAVVRSLARAGYRVFGAREPGRLSGRTRYSRRTHVVPPARDLQGFLAALDAVCAEERVDVVVPLADETLATILRRQSGDVTWHVVGPTLQAYESLSDKSRLASTAVRAGLGAARQVLVGPDETLEELPPLPAYVKVVSGITEGVAAGRPVRVTTSAECRRAVGRIVAGGRSVIVQEEIVGERWRFHFARRGDVVRHVAARTLADYPPRTGQSTVSVFGPTPERIATAGEALLRTAACEGIGSIQFIVRGGIVYPHDANLRIPASVAGTIAAGLDMPRLGVEIALGRSVAPAAPRTTRLRFVQLHGELAALRDAVRGRDAGRSTSTIAREIALAVLLPGRVAEPFDPRDPLPTLAAIAATRGSRADVGRGAGA